MKTFLVYLGLALLNFVVGFMIYNYSFIHQATPFLTDSQSASSSLLMIKTTIPAYLVSSIVMSIVFYLVAKMLKSKD